MKKPKLLKQYDSQFLGKIDIVEFENTGERHLLTGDCVHGLSSNRPNIKKSYWYNVAEQAVTFCSNKSNPRILMLGLGANTTTNLISQLNSKIEITIVEIDNQIIAAANEFFNLKNQPNTTVKQADVYQLAEQPNAFPDLFDVIIVDVFIGEDPFLSTDTGKPSFIQRLYTWLQTDGTLIFNRPANTDEGRNEGKQLETYLKTMFKEVKSTYVNDPAPYYFQNVVITASHKIN